MIVTETNKVILLGGYSNDYYGINVQLDSILELHSLDSQWKEVHPPLNVIGQGHLARLIPNDKLKILCGVCIYSSNIHMP